MSDEQRSAGPRRWRILVFGSTWVAYAGYYFCRVPYFNLKGRVEDGLGLDTLHLGTIGAVYHLAYTAGQFGTAALGPRLGPRLMLLTGIALTAAANWGFGLTDSFGAFVLLMVLNGLAQGTGWASCVGTLGEWTTRGERGTLMGFWSTCYQVGPAAAGLFVATVWTQVGWRGAFLASAWVLIAVWVVVWLFQRNRPADVGLELGDGDGEAPGDAGGGEWTRQLWVTVLLVGGFYFGVKFIRYALFSWTPYLFERNFGLSTDAAGYLSTAFAVAGVFGAIAAGLISDRLFAGRRAVVGFVMLVGMGLGTVLLATVGAASVVAFTASIAVVGFMLYGPDSLLTGAGAIDVGSRRTALAAAGVINGMGSAGQVLQELVVARAYQASEGDVAPVFATLVAASALALVCLAVVLLRNRRGHSAL